MGGTSVCARKKRSRPDEGSEGDGYRTVATNRKARHSYHILETYEAGLALTGNEVKSLREGRISLDESFGRVVRARPPKHGRAPRQGRRVDEIHLVGCHIAPYEKTGFDRPEPRRPRRITAAACGKLV